MTSPDIRMSSPRLQTGKAYLVGAGPGDPALLTLKAQQILATSDVILYDYLVDKRLLIHCKKGADIIYVGKSGLTGHHMAQTDIEQLMMDKCRDGFSVCRLKGGDPYIFGRGAEEGETLYHAGIPFEVVPGISSAIAAPTYAGIPVTHRDFASAVSFITGHEDPTKPESALDWQALAQMPGTLVFLMGVKQLPQITAQLQQHGKDAETPVAVIRWGTRPQQETVTGTLDTIATIVEARQMLPPCVIVVGPVVSKRPALNWFETLPLFGKTVVVTRAREQASQICQQLTALGAHVIEFPTIQILPPADKDLIQERFKALSTYQWVVFTSPNGVHHAMTQLQQLNMDSRAFAGVKLAVIGPATAEALKAYGLTADLMPESYVAEALFEALKTHLPTLEGVRFLLPRADIAREMLAAALRDQGADVDELAVYQTVMAQDGPDIAELVSALKAKTVDIITFSSSSTVTHFYTRLQQALDNTPDLLHDVTLASIGPVTSQTLRDYFGRVDLEAEVYTIPGLLTALQAHVQNDTPKTMMRV